MALPLVLAGIASAACGAAPRPMTDAETRALEDAGLGAPAVVAAVAGVGGAVERLHRMTDEGEREPVAGVTVEVEARHVGAVIESLREELAAHGVGVFHAEQNFGFGADRVAVVAGDDPWAFLDIVRTDGINFDLTHEAVVAKLREWDGRYGLKLIGAGLDWVQAGFDREPDWDAFAREVYAFCPDVVDQGTETVEALAREMRRSRSVYCWWD